MSLLDAIRRQLLGQAAMMQPEQGMGEATQGLLGQGGQFGGGLLQSNLSQMNWWWKLWWWWRRWR
jgi:hypothetical protein